MWLLIHPGIKVNLCQRKGLQSRQQILHLQPYHTLYLDFHSVTNIMINYHLFLQTFDNTNQGHDIIRAKLMLTFLLQAHHENTVLYKMQLTTDMILLCIFVRHSLTLWPQNHSVMEYDTTIDIRCSKATQYTPGAHFTNDFSITIQMWWKFHFALIQVLIKWSLQNLAHGTTAELSWRVPNFVAIWSTVIELELNEFSIEFELWWKNR